MLLQHLSQAITTLVNDIEKQETNDTELQDMLFGYATYTILSNAAKKFKRFEDQIKEENKEKLQSPCELFLINEIPQVRVFAKVTNPRKTFDKDEFIKAVSDKYNVSAFELHEIAANCEKASAAPVSLSCEVVNVISGS